MRVDLARTAIMRVGSALQNSGSLIVNSGALAIGTTTTAVLGFVYWWLAARLFPPEVIGNASALLSVMALVGLLGEAGLGTLLMGEIVRHPGKERGLVGAAVHVGVAAAGSIALFFVLGDALFMGSTGPIGGWFEGVLFVFGCCLTVLVLLVDQAFIGTLRSSGRMIRLVLFSTFKLMLIGAAVAVGYTSSTAILLTWVAALLASWVGVDLLTKGAARRLFGPPDLQLLQKHRRRVFDHYALDVAALAPGVIMPYLVWVLLSPTINAAFVSLWMLVSMAALVPAAMATVLLPVLRASPQQSGNGILVSLTASMLFSLVSAVFVFTYSRQILALFNPAYLEIAGSDLRLLGFSLLGSTLKFHACTSARLGDTMRNASRWFALGGLLELGLAIAGAKLAGLQGLVVGWTLAVSIEGACAAVILIFAKNLNSAGGAVQKTPAQLQT